MLRILLPLILVLYACPSFGQDFGFLDKQDTAETKVEPEGDLGTFDIAEIANRVDQLTERFNSLSTRTDSIESRLQALEKSNVDRLSSSINSTEPIRRLQSTLLPITSFGPPPVMSGGFTNTVRYEQPTFPRSFGSPVSSSFGGSSGQVVSSNRFEPIVVQAPSIVQTTMPPVVVQTPPPMERRQIVRMPVTRVTSQNVRYEPVQSPSCPGGVCPLPQRTVLPRLRLGRWN